MRTASIAGRSRAAIALVAGAALLGLSACGPQDGGGSDESTPPPSASSDEGGTQETESEQNSAPEGDGATDEQDDEQDDQDNENDGAEADEGAGEDGTDTAGERTRIMLAIDLGLDDGTGEGPPTLPGDELAAQLAAPFASTAECADDLVLEPGAAPVGCVGPTSIDDTAPTQEWVANTVMVPSESGFPNGSQVAVLFSTGTQLPEEADDLLDDDVVLTGLGFGSAFGMEPLSAEQVADSTLETLTSEHSYVRVDQDADWSDVTCEDGLDFTQFETVDCDATTADGTTWDLAVAPGTYVNNDQGLLVGIDTIQDS